jgi:plastocyanin
MKKTFGLIATASVAAAIAAPAMAGGASVRVADNHFSASTVHITRGSTVSWHWVGRKRHNVVFSSFRSGKLRNGSYRHTFRHRGTFLYTCTLHHNMNGKVVVR